MRWIQTDSNRFDFKTIPGRPPTVTVASLPEERDEDEDEEVLSLLDERDKHKDSSWHFRKRKGQQLALPEKKGTTTGTSGKERDNNWYFRKRKGQQLALPEKKGTTTGTSGKEKDEAHNKRRETADQ
jgi:hypothetical protein